MLSYEQLKALLTRHGQEHLLRFWDELGADGQDRLAAELVAIDWEQMGVWIREYVVAPQGVTVPASVQPAPYYPLVPASAADRDLYDRARQRGRELLREGKVAGFTVAGGQGTRLGYDGPKGTFRISPVHGKPLFQLFAEGVARAQERYGVTIPWFIMTSPVNDAPTRGFFAENRFFGLAEGEVQFLVQGTLPAIDFKGRILLGARGGLALSPNGHGGSLLALRDSGALASMAACGIEHISYWQVDNPLVEVFDPLFLGLHDLLDSEMSSRSLTKTGPFEKLGNFCLVDGKTTIIEYSDMPADLAQSTDSNGRLCFRAGSPAIHLLTRRYVERLTTHGLKLPLHRAEKKVPCVDDHGNLVKPDQANAVKLEMFIFDALPLAARPLILEADREEQFGPVKNAQGLDSVDSCRELLLNRAARWLENAGLKVPRGPDGKLACRIELSPRRYLDADDVKAQAAGLRLPPSGGEGYYE